MKNIRGIGFGKEKAVVNYLKNFRTSFGEIDIIAKHNDTIVFIEVKYRKSSYIGTPQER